MRSAPTISTAPAEHPAMDYNFLRQTGIHHLERLAGEQWTDFNLHDPGITILEQLCYAITDLGYRINHDLKDLLADGKAEPYRSLYSPAEILTTNPVTLTDLRKVVIDMDGVRNAWIEPVEALKPTLYYNSFDQRLYLEPASQHVLTLPRGVYRVLIEADGNGADPDLIRAVHERLHACRNLSEDFESPVILDKQPIRVQATIDVGTVEDADRLLAQIYHVLARFISPTVRFYTLTEMLARGLSIDEIMDGPPLKHGFIDTQELERFNRKQGLHASDLIQEIMNVNGVSVVQDLTLSDGRTTDPWYLDVSHAGSRNRIPVLDTSALGSSEPDIRMVRNGVVVHANPERVQQLFDDLQRADEYPPLPESERDIRLPLGRSRNVGRYQSIQHQFPATYGIGALGLPPSAPAQRQAQAKQLKAYLLFFDQLLANSFAQLAHANELFSFYSPQTSTYVTQLIDDPELDLNEIWINDAETRADKLQSIVEEPGSPHAAERKHRFLNHLLARFAEEFTDYSLHAAAERTPTDLIKAKITFLQEYRALSAARNRAFNYIQPTWSNQNVSGLEQRISRKLGLPNVHWRNLADLSPDDPGGFHMLEAILLRPQQDDLTQWRQTSELVGWQAPVLLELPHTSDQQPRTDPFSMRLCFVCPDWISHFNQEFVRRTLREETPAHLDIQVQWLDREEMRAFESAYTHWVTTRAAYIGGSTSQADQSQLTSVKVRAARDRLIDLLRIGNPYPLRDLVLRYPRMVAPRQRATIEILDAQIGVCYQLCDQDGNPIRNPDGTPIAAKRGANQANDQVSLETPAIREDRTFTILAVRDTDAYGTLLALPLETYLRDTASIQVDINPGLSVEPQPAAGQVRSGLQITVAYGDTVMVAVKESQEGISYQLVEAGAATLLSQPVLGNRGTIVLISRPLEEHIEIQVNAYRSQDPTNTARLDTIISARVRLNPKAAFSVDPSTPPIVNYAAPATFSLARPQLDATYQVYQRTLIAADYVTSETPGRIEIPGTGVFVRAPQPLAGDSPHGFDLVGAFQSGNGSLSITTAGLLEDTLFIVVATRAATYERIQLEQAVAVLVRPDPTPLVEALQPTVSVGADGTITIRGTQQGVRYQLRRDPDHMLINAPGYDVRDRALETMRIEVDFVVEAPTDPDAYRMLVLPAGPVTTRTTYNVLATKILTGISFQLTDKATIDIEQASPGT